MTRSSEDAPRPARSWIAKFAEAFHGIWIGVQGQSSFAVHAFFTTLVVITASVLHCTRVEWCLLLGCIGMVMTAEMMNSSIEMLFRGLDVDARERVYPCLHIAAGSVLCASMTSLIIGCIILGYRLMISLGYWSE